MPQLKIAIRLSSLGQPLSQAARTSAEMGAGGVELDALGEPRLLGLSDSGVRQVRKILSDYELQVAAVSFGSTRGYQTEEGLQRRIDATKQTMQVAAQLGCSVVVNQIGTLPNEDEPQYDLLQQVLTDLGNHGHRVGALLAARTGSDKGSDLASFLSRLPAHAVGVDLDPGSLIMNGQSPLEAIDSLGPWITHVHANDGVCDQGRGLEVPLGRGTADFPILVAQLDVQGYHGYYTIERRQSANPIQEIGLAVQYLKAL